MTRKFLANGLIAVNVRSTIFFPFAQKSRFSTKLLRASRVEFICSRNCGMGSFADKSRENVGISNAFQFARRILRASSSCFAAVLYFSSVAFLSPKGSDGTTKWLRLAVECDWEVFPGTSLVEGPSAAVSSVDGATTDCAVVGVSGIADGPSLLAIRGSQLESTIDGRLDVEVVRSFGSFGGPRDLGLKTLRIFENLFEPFFSSSFSPPILRKVDGKWPDAVLA